MGAREYKKLGSTQIVWAAGKGRIGRDEAPIKGYTALIWSSGAGCCLGMGCSWLVDEEAYFGNANSGRDARASTGLRSGVGGIFLKVSLWLLF